MTSRRHQACVMFPLSVFLVLCDRLSTRYITPSLVPRPSFPPFSFWSLAVCKNGGGSPGPFYHVNDIGVYLGRQRWGGVSNWKNELEAFSRSFCPKRWSFKRSWSKKRTALGSKWRTRTQTHGLFPTCVVRWNKVGVNWLHSWPWTWGRCQSCHTWFPTTVACREWASSNTHVESAEYYALHQDAVTMNVAENDIIWVFLCVFTYIHCK